MSSSARHWHTLSGPLQLCRSSGIIAWAKQLCSDTLAGLVTGNLAGLETLQGDLFKQVLCYA